MLFLKLEEIRKQPRHVRMARQKRVRRARNQGAVDLARRDHLGERFVADAREFHARRQVQLDLLDAAGLVGAGLIPVHVLKLDAGLMVQPAAHVDGGGVRPFGRADRLSLEVGRGLDAAFAVHVERAKPEQARSEHRQANDVRVGARHLGGEFGEGQFRHVPFAIEGEARKDLVVPEREPDVLDPLGLHGAGAEIAEMIVVGSSDGELDLVHIRDQR